MKFKIGDVVRLINNKHMRFISLNSKATVVGIKEEFVVVKWFPRVATCGTTYSSKRFVLDKKVPSQMLFSFMYED